MQSIMACCLCVLVTLPSCAGQPPPSGETIRRQVARMKPGRQILIRLHNKEKIKASLVAADETSMRVKPAAGGLGEERTIAFDQLLEVSPLTPRWMAFTGAGIVVGFVAAILLTSYAASN